MVVAGHPAMDQPWGGEMSIRHISAILLLAALIGSCSSSSSDSGNPGGSGIGAAGGTVTSTDGSARLSIPAGALSSNVAITATPMTNPPAAPGLVTANTYDFGPSGTQFALPATLRVTYQPSQLPSGVDPSALHLVVLDGTVWDVVPGSAADTTAHTVTGPINHFSSYGLCNGSCNVGSGGGMVETSFSLSGVAILPGTTVVVDGGIAIRDYLGTVSLSVDSMPPGLSATVSVVPATQLCLCDNLIILTLTASTTAAPGLYTITPTVHAPGASVIITGGLLVRVNPISGFLITTAPDTVALAVGNSAGASVNIARTAFTDPVTLSITGLPSGITAAFSPTQLSGSTIASIVTFTASAAAAAGFSKVIVHGSTSTLPDQADTVTLNVATFAITAIPPTVSLAPGSSASTALRAQRGGGFSGTLTYAVSGMPAGLTASINTTSVTDSLQLVVAASANLVSGVYPLTVTATSGAVTQRVTVTVTVATIGSTYQFDYSGCANKAVWFAYQDGTGPWTVVNGSNNLFAVPVFTSGKGGIAAVLPTATGHNTIVEYLTSTEMATNAVQNGCATGVTGVTLNGSVTGIARTTGEEAIVSLGTASGSTFINGPVQLGNVPSGATDVVAYLQKVYTQSSDSDLVVIVRGATSPGAVNFGGSAAVTATATVNGGSGALPAPQMGYITNASCQAALMYILSPPASSFTFSGVPAALQQAGDLHALTVIDAGTSSGRVVTNWFHTMADQVLTYGAPLSPTIDTVLGSYKRLRASFTLPSDYGFASIAIGPVGQAIQAITESSGYAGGGAMALVTPDFSGLAGFSTAWEPQVGTAQNYDLSAYSGSMFATGCTDGGVSRSADAFGSQ
jgi:hypothetical protein